VARVGRPLALNAEKSAKILALIRAGNYLETAAAAAGVQARTVREWRIAGERLRGQSDLTDEQKSLVVFAMGADEAEAAAESGDLACIDGAVDWKAAAWRLEHRYPKRWGPRIQHVVDEELETFMAQLKANLDEFTFARVIRAANGVPDRQVREDGESEIAERAAKIYGIGGGIPAK